MSVELSECSQVTHTHTYIFYTLYYILNSSFSDIRFNPTAAGFRRRMLKRTAYSYETMCSCTPSFRQPPAAVVTCPPVARKCGPLVTKVSIAVVIYVIILSLSFDIVLFYCLFRHPRSSVPENAFPMEELFTEV